MSTAPRPPLPHWDLFCRVVDNFGDIGVAWRLARGLATHGVAVRLFIDDASALAWMAPLGAAGVQVLRWPADDGAAFEPGDVVVEAFGCDPPAGFVAAMQRRAPPPVWINLEYLSAEQYVERSHGLPSPRPGGPMKWFFYPGFTPRTGGLLREPALRLERAAFDRNAWLAAQGLARRPGERVASLFCYDQAAVPALLHRLAEQPTLLLLTPGPAQRLAGDVELPGLRTAALPWLAQPEFDRLLWSCDLNFVRGEDSLVRAIWAGAPFVWQAYPQHDGAHLAKVEALLDRLHAPADVGALWRAWNAGAPGPLPPWPATEPWRRAAMSASDDLATQPDLVTQLQHFVTQAAADGSPGSRAGC